MFWLSVLDTCNSTMDCYSYSFCTIYTSSCFNYLMKNALILHGTGSNAQANWFPWLKKELEKEGFTVWVPDLPQADYPNIKRYNEFIFENKEFKFNEETIVIGHSSGAVAIFGLLQALPKDVKIDRAFLIGAFKDNLKREDLKQLFEELFDFIKIKKHVNNITFIHSVDDPYCPIQHASYLAVQTGGKLIIQHGEKHYSTETNLKYTAFPFLLEEIVKK